MKKRRILFFIDGPMPTEEQMAQAEEHGAVFRNVRFHADGTKEDCVGVMGFAPPEYDEVEYIGERPSDDTDEEDDSSEEGKPKRSRKKK